MSARTLRIVLIAITVLGVALASYLTYVHYAEIKPLCTAGNAASRCRARSTRSSPACRWR